MWIYNVLDACEAQKQSRAHTGVNAANKKGLDFFAVQYKLKVSRLTWSRGMPSLGVSSLDFMAASCGLFFAFAQPGWGFCPL
jgi:hypothetical protein